MKGLQVRAIEDVEISYKFAAWEFTASWPTRARRSDVVSIIRVKYLGSDPARLVQSSTRINILSNSATSSIVTAMNRVSKEDSNDHLVQAICENLYQWYKKAGRTTVPEPRQREGDRWLLYPLWPSTGGTLVAGGTNTFKSMIAMACAVQASSEIEVLAGNTRATGVNQILYLDYEADEPDFAERLYATLRGAGMPTDPIVAYRHLRVPLIDAAEAIADEIARHGYGGVIIDSLSAAAGGSLVDDELANHFWNAVAYLNVPALVLAHKSEEAIRRKQKRVFGSVMHENRSRMLWDASRDQTSTSVVWEVVSDNNTGRKGHKVAWRVDIGKEGEHDTERLATVQFTAVNPRNVKLGVDSGETLADKISYALLSYGPMTSGEIAKKIERPDNVVRAQLSRHNETLFQKRADTRWEIANPPVE